MHFINQDCICARGNKNLAATPKPQASNDGLTGRSHQSPLVLPPGLHFKNDNIESPCQNRFLGDFPGGAVVKNPPAHAGNTGSSPGPGRSHMPRSN